MAVCLSLYHLSHTTASNKSNDGWSSYSFSWPSSLCVTGMQQRKVFSSDVHLFFCPLPSKRFFSRPFEFCQQKIFDRESFPSCRCSNNNPTKLSNCTSLVKSECESEQVSLCRIVLPLQEVSCPCFPFAQAAPKTPTILVPAAVRISRRWFATVARKKRRTTTRSGCVAVRAKASIITTALVRRRIGKKNTNWCVRNWRRNRKSCTPWSIIVAHHLRG